MHLTKIILLAPLFISLSAAASEFGSNVPDDPALKQMQERQKKIDKKFYQNLNNQKEIELKLSPRFQKKEALRRETARGTKTLQSAKRAAWFNAEQELDVGPLLVLLVEFDGSKESDSYGPLHNTLQPPGPDDTDNWTKDFNTAYYDDMLFKHAGLGTDAADRTVANFYYENSGGRYTPHGEVFEWIKLPYSIRRYGQDVVMKNGSVRTDSECLKPAGAVKDCEQAQDTVGSLLFKDLAEELKRRAKEEGLDLRRFDKWDRYDYNGNGRRDEPDGYIDHMVVIFAGLDQASSKGAKAQLDNKAPIWPHRSYANYQQDGKIGPKGFDLSHPNAENLKGGWTINDENTLAIGDYIIQAENTGMGVIAHEFGHDWGLPDLYNTRTDQPSRPDIKAPATLFDNSVAFWSLMSSGSHTYRHGNGHSDPHSASPSHMGPREKLELGFIRSDEVTTFDPSDVNTVVGQTHTVFLGQSTYPNDRNYDRILKINLPDYKSTVVLAKPSSGSKQAYAGRADKLTATMRQEIDLTSVSAAVLEFMTYYEIEKDYDYGYVEVSTDSGKTFATLPGTVAGKPTQSSAQLGNYITGMMVEPAPALKTMQPASYDLTAYAGKKVLLQFRYGTDEGYTEIGWFVDDVRVTGKTASGAAVAIFSDDFETGNQWATAAINWQTSGDTKVSNFRRYLLAEWRHHNGFNEGLKSVYNTVNGVGQQERLEYHSYEEGLLVWYVNEFYGDNNVTRFSGDLSSGIKYDAGEGYALVVDAHPKSMLQTGGKDGGVALDGLPFRTRVQAYDAPFSLTPASALKLSLAGFDFTSPSYEADSAWTSAQKPGNQELSLGCEPDDAAQYFTKPMATNKVSQFHGVKLPADANVKLRIREVTADDTAVAVDVVRCK